MQLYFMKAIETIIFVSDQTHSYRKKNKKTIKNNKVKLNDKDDHDDNRMTPTNPHICPGQPTSLALSIQIQN